MKDRLPTSPTQPLPHARPVKPWCKSNMKAHPLPNIRGSMNSEAPDPKPNLKYQPTKPESHPRYQEAPQACIHYIFIYIYVYVQHTHAMLYMPDDDYIYILCTICVYN